MQLWVGLSTFALDRFTGAAGLTQTVGLFLAGLSDVKMRTMTSLLFLVASVSAAVAGELDATLSGVATAVSGKMSPLVIAVDGKKVIKEDVTIVELTVNGQPVTPKKKEKGKPFFIRTEGDTLQMKAKTADGESLSWDFPLPTLALAEATSETISFEIQGKTAAITVDGAAIRRRGDSASWKVPAGHAAFAKARVVELIVGKGKPGRLYNLRLTARPVVVEAEPAREPAANVRDGASALDFRVSQVSVFQKSGGNSFSPMVSWNPSYFMSQDFSIGLGVSLSYFKAATGTKFLAYSVEGCLQFIFEDFGLGLGGGIQSWVNYGGTKALASLDLSYLFSQPLLDFADRVVVGYSAFFSVPDASHEIRVGIGFSL